MALASSESSSTAWARVVPIDVQCAAGRGVQSRELASVVVAYIRQRCSTLNAGQLIPLNHASDLLRSAVRRIRVCDCAGLVFTARASGGSSWATVPIATDDVELAPFLYRLACDEAYDEPLEQEGDELGGSGGGLGGESPLSSLASCTVLPLPHASLEGLWESLYYGDSVASSAKMKLELLQYATTALLFSRVGVSHQLVTWNRMILFHGPPGTGKTSVCKAFAQKLAIRLRPTFSSSQLVEVNAHSLFSRWFSESGKQVMLLFQRIRELVEDTSCLVCLLIDEVESLAAARHAAVRGNEPSDAIRAVNALLTQLDSLQRHRNVIVLATSNITGAIDLAFIDRADKKVYLGPPGLEARVRMLSGSTAELVRKGLLQMPRNFVISCLGGAVGDHKWCDPAPENQDFGARVAESQVADGGPTSRDATSRDVPLGVGDVAGGALTDDSLAAALAAYPPIAALAASCDGFTGRTMRKLPFLAFGLAAAGHVLGPKERSSCDEQRGLQSSPSSNWPPNQQSDAPLALSCASSIPLEHYLAAMHHAVLAEHDSCAQLATQA